MKELKVVPIKEKEAEEVYIDPITDDLFNYAKDWIKEMGCSEMQIIIVSGCKSFSEIFDSEERTDVGLGAIARYSTKYAIELNALDEESE